MSFAARAEASVKRLIRHAGGELAVELPAWVPNPSGAGTVRGSGTAATVLGLLVDSSQGEGRTQVQRDELEVLLLPYDTSGSAITLEKDAYVTVGGRKLQVVDPRPCQPNGTVLYYRALVRQETPA